MSYSVSETVVVALRHRRVGWHRAGQREVKINTGGLAAGTYSATIRIDAAGAAGAPRDVPVTLTINPARGERPGRRVGFEETSGDTALDASGKRNTGTLMGATRTASGVYGRGLSTSTARTTGSRSPTTRRWISPTE